MKRGAAVTPTLVPTFTGSGGLRGAGAAAVAEPAEAAGAAAAGALPLPGAGATALLLGGAAAAGAAGLAGADEPPAPAPQPATSVAVATRSAANRDGRSAREASAADIGATSFVQARSRATPCRSVPGVYCARCGVSIGRPRMIAARGGGLTTSG